MNNSNKEQVNPTVTGINLKVAMTASTDIVSVSTLYHKILRVNYRKIVSLVAFRISQYTAFLPFDLYTITAIKHFNSPSPFKKTGMFDHSFQLRNYEY